MGKTKRKRSGHPLGGINMIERSQKEKDSDWYELQKEKRSLTNKLRKMKNR